MQWQRKAVGAADIAGATGGTYMFTTAAADHGSQYRAVFTNTLGTATTAAVTLSVHLPPQVTAHPQWETVPAGQTASFTAAASGRPTPTVQWQRKAAGASAFADVSGATGLTYTFTVQAVDDGAQYRAVFSNAGGTATTTPATLLQATPAVTTGATGPAAGAYKAGTNLDLTITYDQAVAVMGTPRVPITVGGVSRFAAYQGGAGTTALTFRYTVQAGDNGVLVRSSPSDPNGGTITNFGLPGGLSFTPPTTTDVRADTTALTVTAVSRSTPTGQRTNAATVVLVVMFSEAVKASRRPPATCTR